MTATSVSGVVAVANGGTGSATQNFVDLTSNQTNIGGNKTLTGVLSGNGSGLTSLTGANLDARSITAREVGDLSVTSTALGDGGEARTQCSSELQFVLAWFASLGFAHTVFPQVTNPEAAG